MKAPNVVDLDERLRAERAEARARREDEELADAVARCTSHVFGARPVPPKVLHTIGRIRRGGA